MKDGEYWKERFKQMEEAQHDTSLKKAQEIQEQFDRSLAAIDGKINAWYQRLANNNGVSMQEARKMLNKGELKEFQWNVDDYIKYAKENEISDAWEKQLENASARVHISRLEAFKIETQQELEKLYGNITDSIDKHIANTYANDFYHTAYEIQKGIGVGSNIQKLNPQEVEKVSCKPWAVDEKNFSDRIWENKAKLINNMHNSLSRMCITGEAPDRAIAEIVKSMGVSKSQASRLVMTESAAFANKARQDCMVDLGVEEFEVVETLDSHTCEFCQSMDGKHFPMKDFEIGVTAPIYHPNCRGCTCPYFNDEFTQDEERAARGAGGKTYYVPANTTYEQWKKAFVDGDTKGFKKSTKTEIAKEQKDYTYDLINPKYIDTVNDITDNDKFDALTYEFEKNGYNGRPIVAVDMGDGQYKAITGSHRIYSARRAEIDIPTHVIDYADDIEELLEAADDDARYRVAKKLNKANKLDDETVELLKEESMLDVDEEEDYSKLAKSYRDEKKLAEEQAEKELLIAEEEAKKAEEKLKEAREASEEMQEYKQFYAEMKAKYGEEHMYGKMTDPEYDKLERLERIAYTGS